MITDVGKAVAAAFTARPRLPNGSVLAVCGGAYSWNDFVLALRALRHNLEAVSVLDLNGSGLGYAELTLLLSSPYLGGLRRLDLANNRLTDMDARALASSPVRITSRTAAPNTSAKKPTSRTRPTTPSSASVSR